MRSIADAEPVAGRPSWARIGCLSGLGVPVALVFGVVVTATRYQAAFDCRAYGPGHLFTGMAVSFVVAAILWLLAMAPLWLIGRRSLRMGVVLALVVPLVASVCWVAGTPDLVRASPSGVEACPTGTPGWWPWLWQRPAGG